MACQMLQYSFFPFTFYYLCREISNLTLDFEFRTSLDTSILHYNQNEYNTNENIQYKLDILQHKIINENKNQILQRWQCHI